MGCLGLRPKLGERESRKNIHQSVVERGRRTDCPESPPDQGNQCAAVCRCRDVSQQLRGLESRGCPLGPCLGLHRQGTWCWGRGCRTQTGLRSPQPCMTRLTFSAPPCCFALPGAQAHLSVTSPHRTSAKGAAECWTPEWSRAWSTAGHAAHTSLPCPDALLPVRHPWLPETTWQLALWHRDLCGRQ